MILSLLLATGACVIAAILEAALAGRGVKQRFAELRMPRFSPPLSLWIAIGVAYYLICGVVLYRVLSLPFGRWRTLALVLIAIVLLANALWNYTFFRVRNLRLSFLVSVCYSLVALALLGVLFFLDRIAASLFLAYTIYLAYANAWGYALIRCNSPSRGRESSAS